MRSADESGGIAIQMPDPPICLSLSSKSAKNAVLKSAASAGVKKGESLVFDDPGSGSLANTNTVLFM
jgi:hypothetical protein